MNAARKNVPDRDELGLAGALCDCFTSGVIIVDAGKAIRAFTASAEQLTGIPAAEAINGDSKLLPAALLRVLNRVLDTGKAAEEQNVTLTVGSGKITVHATAVPLEAGKVCSGVALVLTGIVPSRQFEQKLDRLDRLASIGTLSAGMAHEIKNALVSIKTFIDLLLDKNQDAELADVVRREMRRVNALVSQTLKFAGPAHPTLAALHLHDVLDHSLRMVGPQIQSKLIELNRSFQAAPDLIQGDDYQLEQVFVNLLLNALEALGNSGSLTVATEIVSVLPAGQTVREPVPHIRVTVADTGPGIAPDHMARLFEPFFTTKENGTGLGLAIARRIVESHHGKIEVLSEVSKGTTLSVMLPSPATAG